MSSVHSKLLLMCIMCSCGLNALETELDWPQANPSSCCHVVIKPGLLFHITGRLQSSAGSSHVLSLPAALQKSCSSESTRVVRMKLKMLTLEKNFYGDMKTRAGKEFIWKLSSRPAEDWNVVCADHKVSLIKLPWQLRPPPVSSLPREQRNHKFVIFPPKPNLSFT